MTGPAQRRPGGLAATLLAALCWTSTLGVAGAAAEPASFVVHLPTTPVENASRRAEAVQRLGQAITSGVPGLELETKIFRRFEDAEGYLASHDDVALVLSDAAWVPDLPTKLVASYGLTVGGRTTYRRLLVAKGEATSLGDLRGASLAIVEAAGPGRDAAYLERRVFGGELDPATWFGGLRPAADDAGAVTDVLYGEADAGLVAEINPLLSEHLGEGLRLVYTGDELPLPVLSVNVELLDEGQRAALSSVLLGLEASGDELAGLGFDAFRALDAEARGSLLAAPESVTKRFELPAPPRHELPPLDPPELEQLPLVLELPLPEPPSAAGELLAGEAGLETSRRRDP